MEENIKPIPSVEKKNTDNITNSKKQKVSPIKTFKDSLDDSPKLRLALFTGVGMFVLGILIICIIVLFGISKDKNGGNDKIVLENINEEDAEELNRQIIYSTNDDENQVYYSPTLDLLITFDKEKFSVSEGIDSIDLQIQNVPYSFDVYGSIESYQVTEPNKVFINRYQGLYDQFKIIEEKQEDEFTILKISYQKKSYFEDQEFVEVNHYIISKKVDDSYVSINFAHGKEFNIEDFKEDFKNILNTAELSPDNVNQNSVVEISDPKMKFSFDIKKWELTNQSEYGASLSFRSSDFETDPNYKYSYTSLRINSNKMFGPIDEKYLTENYINPEVQNANEFYGDKNLKLLTQNEKKTIDGVDFFKVSYSYDSYGTRTTKEIYIGYDKSTGNVIEISVTFEGEGTKGEEEIRKVMETIDFYDDGAELMATYTSVLGASTSNKTVEIQKSSVLGKLSVVHIFNKSCVTATFESDPSLPKTSGKTYDGLCTAGFGSGFYINKDGYIATNSHVAHFNPLDIVVTSLSYGDNQFFTDLASDLDAIYKAEGIDVATLDDDQYLFLVIDGINKLIESKVLTLDAEYTNYIEGKEQFEINRADLSLSNVSAHKKATTVSANEIDSLYSIAINNALGTPDGIKVPDLTILKVENSNSADLPALKLADPELISPGQEILAIGFPGSAENNQLFATEANRISTMTNGTISAIKPNFNSSFDLIQIDASISHGNSGGPIVNLDGEVVAVSTYGINSGEQAESADFNAGVSVEEVIKIIGSQNIENDIGLVSTNITTGLDEMSKEHYKLAVEDFEYAIELYPDAEEILAPLIKISNQKIEAGEDKSPAFTIGDIELTQSQFTIAIIAVVGLSIGLVVILIVVFMVLLSKLLFGGKKKTMASPQQPSQSIGYGMNTTRPSTPASSSSYMPPQQNQPVATPPVQQTNNQSYMPPQQN